MTPIPMTALKMAERFVGVKEAPGQASDPLVLAMLRLDQTWPEGDHVAWCSAFANWIAWLLELPRSGSLAARSWLQVGRSIGLHEAEPGFDVVVFSRGPGRQPGPEVLDAPGHVGFFFKAEPGFVKVVGGNQSDAVTVGSYRVEHVLGVRRLLG